MNKCIADMVTIITVSILGHTARMPSFFPCPTQLLPSSPCLRPSGPHVGISVLFWVCHLSPSQCWTQAKPG